MTPHEALSVLIAARDLSGFQRWDDVVEMLSPVYETNLLAGVDQGEMAFLLGQASEGKGHWVFAHQYLTDAARLGSDRVRADAQQHLAAIARLDKAMEAEGGGVVQAEAPTVLAAADDALARGDFDGAMVRYRSVFDSSADGAERLGAALGISRSCAYLGNLVEAGQFADYVVDGGDAKLAGQARELAEWVRSQQAASTSAADGVTVDEYNETMDAGRSAFFVDAHEQALAYFLVALASPQVGGADRGRAAYNAGLCERVLGRDAEARAHFEVAGSDGAPQTAQRALVQLDRMDRSEAAAELVAELAPD